jgi:hypothetical protein
MIVWFDIRCYLMHAACGGVPRE